MPCSINFSLTLQTEILPTETSYCLKQIIVLKLLTPVLYTYMNLHGYISLLTREITCLSFLNGAQY